jgi:hypothetical protein
MKIADESEQIRTLSEQAFAGPREDRGKALELLREVSSSAADSGEREQAVSGSPLKAVEACVTTYQADRATLIEYRRRNGLAVDDDD